MRWQPNTEQDLWNKVEVGLPDHCWPYDFDLSTRGYGRFSFNGQRDYAHRMVYRMHYGSIPSGKVVDHTCHNTDPLCPGGPACRHRKCCNPYHMELVSQRENINRSKNSPVNQEACIYGHEFTEENTYYRPDGKGRQCKQCIKIRTQKQLAKKRNRNETEPSAKGCPGK